MRNEQVGSVLERGHKVASEKPKAKWIPVNPALFQLDALVPFDLYLPRLQGEAPVLYRSKNLPFTGDVYERIKALDGIQLLIKADDAGVYEDFVEAHLSRILSNQLLPMPTRSKVLYNSAKRLVRQIIDNPQMHGLAERSGQMVENMVSFLFVEGTSFQHLLKITSYDYYTYTHCVNVFIFSTSLAKKVGFKEEEVFQCGQGALLHDIGKSLVPAEILNYQGVLSEDQFEEVKKHPVYGYDLLVENGVNNPIVLDVVRHHHEKLQGQGYPDRLGEADISSFARIATIADIFDALTTERVYKQAMPSFPSLKLMKEQMDGELDKQLFNEFIALMASGQSKKH